MKQSNALMGLKTIEEIIFQDFPVEQDLPQVSME